MQQRLQLDLRDEKEIVPWCCVVSDNSKVQHNIQLFEVESQHTSQADAIRQLDCVMANFRR